MPILTKLTMSADVFWWTVANVRVIREVFLTSSSILTFLIVETLAFCNTSARHSVMTQDYYLIKVTPTIVKRPLYFTSELFKATPTIVGEAFIF